MTVADPLQMVSLEIAYQCNHHCTHCYNYWRDNGRGTVPLQGPMLNREEIKRLLAQIKKEIPLKYVGITGGEPLLRANFAEIVGDVVDLGLEPIIVTNAALLDRARQKRLPNGLSYEITLFSFQEKIHNQIAGRNSFQAILRNIAELHTHQARFTHVFIATKTNYRDVYRTVELALALGAAGVLYNRVNVGKRTGPAILPSVQELDESLSQFDQVVGHYHVSASCAVPIPACLLHLEKFSNLSFGWCPRGNGHSYYTISVDGKLRPCNHSSIILGDLRKDSFSCLVEKGRKHPLWNSVPVICLTCTNPFREHCLGGCPAAAMEYYGSLLNPDPILELCGKGRMCFNHSIHALADPCRL